MGGHNFGAITQISVDEQRRLTADVVVVFNVAYSVRRQIWPAW